MNMSVVDFHVLPEDCISNILSLTTPVDACRLSLVSSIFSSAANSDAVWQRFLLPDYLPVISKSSRFEQLVSLPKKQPMLHGDGLEVPYRVPLTKRARGRLGDVSGTRGIIGDGQLLAGTFRGRRVKLTAVPRHRRVFNICDCYVRRPDQAVRVIGTLLGSILPNGTVDIRNSFAVPYTEAADQVLIDIEYHHSMLISNQKVNPKEVIVGWYSTGFGVTGVNALIHDFYANEVSNPVHLVVDTGFTNGEGSIKAFVSNNLSLGDRQLAAQFLEIPLDFVGKLLFRLSLSSCERNWSTYAFIHSLRRNRLNPSRAEDLVFIHNNLRLLSRNSDAYQDEKNKLWDVGGDTFDSMDDVGFLEFAELLLDEPELENELINDNP